MQIMFNGYLAMLGWMMAIAIIWAVLIPILIWIIEKISGEIKIWQEIRRQNIALAILLGTIIIGISMIIGGMF